MSINNIDTIYNCWITNNALDDNLRKQLLSIDEKEKQDAFYKNLEFGTGGMRGILGAGINRMNIYTIRRATQGLCVALEAHNRESGVVIAYDTRNFSDIFARETAKVLLANGVHVYLFESNRSTPELSFAVRHLNAGAGIVITASHNPKEYNGYKVYGEDGSQFPPHKTDIISTTINELDIFADVKILPDSEFENNQLLHMIGKEIDDAFINAVERQMIDKEVIEEQKGNMKLVYTPFHGTGKMPIMKVLSEMGFSNVYIVEEQATPDGDFPTVKFPNPEVKESFEMAIALAIEKDVDLIIGTDPDCDRVGVVVRDKTGEYRILSGNQTGSLLCEYVLRAKAKKGILTAKSAIVKTIVTTTLPDKIAAYYGVKAYDVFTGFKFIGEKIKEFEDNDNGTYEFGFEESYGYLIGTHARDKDAVVATMLIAEMAAWYAKRGMSLYEGLGELYEKYGYFEEKTLSILMLGKDGMEKMQSIMDHLRGNISNEIEGLDILASIDYLHCKRYENGTTGDIPDMGSTSNVLKYLLADNKSWFAIRPSGTEPKIKIYFGTCDVCAELANKTIHRIEEIVEKLIKTI